MDAGTFFDLFLNEVGQGVLLINQGNAQGGVEGDFKRDYNFFTALQTFVAPAGVLADFDLDGDLDYYTISAGGIFNPTKTQDHLLINDLP